MSALPPGKAAGVLPGFWRAALLTGVLSVHGLGFALMPEASANGRAKAQGPAILQASWIVATAPAAPAAPVPLPAAPEPVAMPVPVPMPPEPVAVPVPPEPVVTPEPPVKPKVAVKPRPKAKAKPLLTQPANAPEPVTQTVAVPLETREDAPASESAPRENTESAARSAPAAATNPAKAAGGATVAGTAGGAGGAGGAGAASEGASGSPVIPPSHADYLANPRPAYPSVSRTQGEQGVVSLFVHVSAEGQTRSIAVHQTSGYERLDKAATEAVWRWRFVPARRNGQPVAGAVIVPIRFKLRS